MPGIMNILAARPSAAASSFSLTYTDTGSNFASSSSYTFSTKSFGAADAGRIMVLGIGRTDGTAGDSIGTVTIGGVAATQRVSAATTGNYGRAWIYTAPVPTGTTGDVVVAFTSPHSSHSCFIALWRLVGASNEDPGVSGFEATASDTDLDVGASLQIPTGGAGVGVSCFTPAAGATNRTCFGAASSSSAGTSTRTSTYTDGSTDVSWTNLTEDTQAVNSLAIDSAKSCIALASWSP